jgi:ribosome-associated protein
LKKKQVQKKVKSQLQAERIRKLALDAIEDLKGQNIVCLDIGTMSTFADFMIVVTGTSSRHVKSLAEEVSKRSKEAGVLVRMEGDDQAEWILIDLGDVIVHVMLAPVRQLYDLESLWKLAPAGQ